MNIYTSSLSIATSLPVSYQAKYMVELEFQVPTTFDPFAEANDNSAAAGGKEYVHIRIQQRNGKKSLTTVQGLKKEFSYDKILKDLKKEFCCNGTVVQDKELGKVIQLQGDQRKNVSNFLVKAAIVKKDQIKLHGFLKNWAWRSGVQCI
ncbi:translation initiation factor SUI1 family protein [Actinidia rufa]|uniref:Translation initiation factor SUI1 family protein n=1 Tax=Actinidia rufa TaxID=165716 RepID=A0A7J0G299_9ERIC|nr:translation initiation factor SUI1 family protein [Actinidia rufa]